MNRKGIILAGGSGTRLAPLTNSISKQLLPIYDKPLIYYPLTTFMLSGIREILIITTPTQLNLFKELLGNGSQLGIDITYKTQLKPNGIAEAFLIGEEFIGNSHSALILGDNLFHGHYLMSHLKNANQNKEGATIFLYPVNDRERYGIVNFDKEGNIIDIQEKPKKPKSNLAITGLYIFDARVTLFSRNLKLSKRGETEIVDLLRIYHKNNELNFRILNRGIAWIDTGTPESLINASQYIEIIEKRQNTKIACIEEISLRMNFIDKKRYLTLIKSYNKSPYKNYLKSILNK